MRIRSSVVGIALAVLCAVPAGGGPARAAEQDAFAIGVGVNIRTPADLDYVAELHGGKPFGVRVPLAWNDFESVADLRIDAARLAAAEGYAVSVVLRYVPPAGDLGLPADFADWVSLRAAELATTPGIDIEVGNRPGAASADPGTDAGSMTLDAVILGVLAADAAAPAARTGLSWLHDGVPATATAWWTALGSRGGAELTAAVDVVDVQIYPGSLGPPATWSGTPLGPRYRAQDAITHARRELMPRAGLGSDVPIVVGEFSYPVAEVPPVVATGGVLDGFLLRTEPNQVRMLRDIHEGISWVAAANGVERAMWFDLRDPPEGCGALGCFGLVRPDGSRRPAFFELAFQQSRTDLG